MLYPTELRNLSRCLSSVSLSSLQPAGFSARPSILLTFRRIVKGFLERPLIFFSGSFYHSYSVFKDRREVSPSPFQPNRCAEGCQGGKAYFFRLPLFRRGLSSPPLYSIHLPAGRQGERVFYFRAVFHSRRGFSVAPIPYPPAGGSARDFLEPK